MDVVDEGLALSPALAPEKIVRSNIKPVTVQHVTGSNQRLRPSFQLGRKIEKAWPDSPELICMVTWELRGVPVSRTKCRVYF